MKDQYEWKDVYVTGCNHVNDKIMLKYRPQFSTMEEHDNETWGLLDQVPEDKIVIFLGDNFLSPESLIRLKQYKFYKVHVLGNHDLQNGVNIKMITDVMDEVHGSIKMDGIWFSHIPMHKHALGHGYINIHAHMHTDTLYDDRYVNVSMEATNYRLFSVDEILNGRYVPFSFLPKGRTESLDLTVPINVTRFILDEEIFDQEGNLVAEIKSVDASRPMKIDVNIKMLLSEFKAHFKSPTQFKFVAGRSQVHSKIVFNKISTQELSS